MIAARTELISFYTDNDKTCARNNMLLKKDLELKIKKSSTEAHSMASDALKQIQDMKNSSPTNATCPQSTLIGHNTLHIERLSEELKSIKDSLGELDLKGSTAVGRKKKKDEDLSGDKNSKDDNYKHDTNSFQHKNSNNNKNTTNKKNSGRKSVSFESPANGDTPMKFGDFNVQKSVPGKKKIILFMDSNRHFLDPSLLWENLSIVPTGNIPELIRNIERNDLREYDVVMIHVGVNDIDTTDGVDVARKLVDVTSRVKLSAPGVKIIISEVTPRQLFRDNEVLACNKEMKILQHAENITVARHSNLRDEQWSFHKPKDDKHFTQFAMARLAGNLKAAFRQALNIRPRRPPTTGYHGGKGEGRNFHQGKRLDNDKHMLLKQIIELLR